MELCIEVYNSIPPHLYTFIPPLTPGGALLVIARGIKNIRVLCASRECAELLTRFLIFTLGVPT